VKWIVGLEKHSGGGAIRRHPLNVVEKRPS
jgi:hypothetical protein